MNYVARRKKIKVLSLKIKALESEILVLTKKRQFVKAFSLSHEIAELDNAIENLRNYKYACVSSHGCNLGNGKFL